MVKMMKSLVVTTFVVVLVCLRAEDLTARYDRELLAVLQWEILWHQLPSGSHVPPSGVTKFAVQITSDNLSYCSHELGVCEKYKIGDYRNWEAVANALCNDKRSDEEVLRAFVGAPSPELAATGASPRFRSKAGGRTGVPVEGSGILWNTATNLGSLPDIVQQYKRMHPPELGALQKWLGTTPLGEHVSRIRVPCFATTDPSVFLSVTASDGEREVQTIFWNRVAGRWELATGFDPPADPVVLNQIRRTIDSVTCANIAY